MTDRPWYEDDAILRRDFGKKPIREIAADLGRSYQSVESRISRLELRVIEWTEENNAYLLANWPTSQRITARTLGYTIPACRKQYDTLVPKEPEEPVDEDRARVFTLPPQGPGYGPRTIHRISAQ